MHGIIVSVMKATMKNVISQFVGHEEQVILVMILTFIQGHTAIINNKLLNAWGWVSYEELWRARMVLRITPSEISLILLMIQKPNSIIVLLFIQNNS